MHWCHSNVHIISLATPTSRNRVQADYVLHAEQNITVPIVPDTPLSELVCQADTVRIISVYMLANSQFHDGMAVDELSVHDLHAKNVRR